VNAGGILSRGSFFSFHSKLSIDEQYIDVNIL
jgi:hypothetical protein